MLIDELSPEQAISFLVIAGEQQLEFPSKVLEVFPRKHMLFADAIIRDNKILSLRGKGLIVHIVVSFPDQKPIIFQNVIARSIRNKENALCYAVQVPAEGREFNRRQSYRCFLGMDSSVRAGANREPFDAIIKDVSATGFAITAPADKEIYENDMVHTVLNDYIDETSRNYSFHLFGSVVRVQPIDNGKIVYGCKLVNPVVGLDRYIMEKERIRLRHTRGGDKRSPKSNENDKG